ncbi:hypothetical protein RCZ04_03760 [Capnocytophaga sp. HP1101]
MVIAILTVFIMLNVVLKLSFWKLWQQAVFAGICFLFVWFATDFASEQSQPTLEAMLSDPKVLSNITVLLTIETAVCMAYCFTSLRALFKGKESRWYRILQWYPNLLVFPALFYVLTQAIFYYTGVSFEHIALWIGAGVLVFIVLGAWGLQKLLPEKDLRLELHFLVSLLITLLGLIGTANGQILYVPQSEPIDVKVLGSIFLFFIALFGIGFGFSKLYWFLHQRKQKN